MTDFDETLRTAALLFVAGIMALGLFWPAIADDWKAPSTWGRELGRLWATARFCAVFSVLFWGGLYLAVSLGADASIARGVALMEFQTGLVESLERVGGLRDADDEAFRDAAGAHEDGSRFALLRDGAGPVVRVTGLTHAACVGSLSSLSPHARRTLVLEDGQARQRGWKPLGKPEDDCPADGAAANLSFRSGGKA